MKQIGEMTKNELLEELGKVEANSITPGDARMHSAIHQENELSEIQMLRYELTFKKYFSALIEQTAKSGSRRFTLHLNREDEYDGYFPEVEGDFNVKILTNVFLKYLTVREMMESWLQNKGFRVLYTCTEFTVIW